MGIRSTICAAFSLALAFAPWSARAQQATRALQVGTPIRVTLTDGSVVTGRAGSSTDSAIVILSGSGDRTVPIRSIRLTEIRHSAWRNGAAIGIVAGSLLATAYFAALTDAYCQSSSCAPKQQVILAGIAVGAVPGFVVGATIGAFRVHWAPDEQPLTVGPTLDRHIVARATCAGSRGGHIGLGKMIGGGVAAGAGIVVSCQPLNAITIDGGFSDIPDQVGFAPSGNSRFSRIWIARTGIADEFFLGGGFRWLLSIDGYRYYQSNEDSGPRGASYTQTGRFGVGAGAGLAHSLRLGESVGLRSELRTHIRGQAGPEWSVLVGLERIHRVE